MHALWAHDHGDPVSRPSANTLYRTAQMLVRTGQPVFPCRAETISEKRKAKQPLIRNGLHAATLDVAEIKGWFKKFGSNIALGMPTGILWDVLDVDVKGQQDGRVHLAGLQELGLLNGCQRVAKTPSGGMHLYFHAAPGLSNRASATLGLDVRAKGGYVLAAPSWVDDHEDSVGCYEDHGPTTGASREPLLWDLIVATLEPIDIETKKPIPLLGYERRASLASLRGWLSERISGERNNALHWAVCRCIENGIDPYELFEVALHIGLGEEETKLTMDSALRRAGVTLADLDSEGEAMFPEVQPQEIEEVTTGPSPEALAMFPD